jgi:hypothetical protein
MSWRRVNSELDWLGIWIFPLLVRWTVGPG